MISFETGFAKGIQERHGYSVADQYECERENPAGTRLTKRGFMETATASNSSIETSHRTALPAVMWEDIVEHGAYVEKGSGDLYRIPKEALIPGASPLVVKESCGASRLMKLSTDPFITTVRARLLCAQHNIDPNF